MADMDLPPSSSDDESDTTDQREEALPPASEEQESRASSDTADSPGSEVQQHELDRPAASGIASDTIDQPARAPAQDTHTDSPEEGSQHAFAAQMQKMQLREESKMPSKT